MFFDFNWSQGVFEVRRSGVRCAVRVARRGVAACHSACLLPGLVPCARASASELLLDLSAVVLHPALSFSVPPSAPAVGTWLRCAFVGSPAPREQQPWCASAQPAGVGSSVAFELFNFSCRLSWRCGRVPCFRRSCACSVCLSFACFRAVCTGLR